MKHWIVATLERACNWTHWITHHRPYLWLRQPCCPFAAWSANLDERWHTGVWTSCRDRSEDTK